MTQESIKKVEGLADELRWEWGAVGIRTQEEPFAPGPIDHVSHVWIDGEDTGEELEGICAIEIGALKWAALASRYYGRHVAIVCGDSCSWGEDEGEIIIQNPVVVEVLA